MEKSDNQSSAGNVCPSCGEKGKAVKALTIESLVPNEARQALSEMEGFKFCSSKSCPIAYFHPETNELIDKSQLKVRIGQKEDVEDRQVCYCFNHSAKDIAEAFTQNGKSAIFNDIKKQCKQGKDNCTENNPQGSCCLSNVKAVVKGVQTSDPVALESDTDSCCASPCSTVEMDSVTSSELSRQATESLKLAGLALLAALLSSACCWLPLLLLAFGASAVGAAAFFETFRGVFLGLTGLLLAGGFYYVYFRKNTCSLGNSCGTPRPGQQKFTKVSLWLITGAVLIFAFFPNYIGTLTGAGNHITQNDDLPKLSFTIDSMTCEGCATKIDRALEALPEVEAAEINYPEGKALIFLKKDTSLERRKIIQALAETGDFQAKFSESLRWKIGIEGMTCEGCTVQLQAKLVAIPGLKSAKVNYATKSTLIQTDPSVSENSLRQAVSEAGYSVRSITKGDVK